MIRRVLAAAAAVSVASCATAPPPPHPAPAPVVAAAVATPPAPPQVPPPVVILRRQYRRAEKKEVPAVTSPSVTAEYVRDVHAADLAARRALVALERQGRHPTQQALATARKAVRDLATTLEKAPQ
jgi:hypothetical protein